MNRFSQWLTLATLSSALNRRFCIDEDSLQDIERLERDTGQALRWPAALTGVS